MILGVKTWAFAHLLVNGDTFSIFVFGITLAWAVFSFRSARKMASMIATGPRGKYSIHASAATFFIGIMIWLYIIRAGHEYLAGIGLLIAHMTLAIKIQIMNELFYVWKHSVELRLIL